MLGHKSDVKMVRFTPDDLVIVSGSDDRTGIVMSSILYDALLYVWH